MSGDECIRHYFRIWHTDGDSITYISKAGFKDRSLPLVIVMDWRANGFPSNYVRHSIERESDELFYLYVTVGAD